MPILQAPSALLHPGYIAGRYYPTCRGILTNGSAISAVDTIYLYPFIMPASIAFTAGRVRIQTGGAGSSMKSAIWANDPATMYPVGAPLFSDNTGIATTSSTTEIAVPISGSLSAGVMYWFGAKFTGTLPTLWSVPTLNTETIWLSGMNSAAMNANAYAFADAYSNNMPTLAANAAVAANAAPIPHLWLAT